VSFEGGPYGGVKGTSSLAGPAVTRFEPQPIGIYYRVHGRKNHRSRKGLVSATARPPTSPRALRPPPTGTMTVDRTRDAHAKAAVLAEALPYIREFTGRTVVIKDDAKKPNK